MEYNSRSFFLPASHKRLALNQLEARTPAVSKAPIPTFGEVFHDAFLEPIRPSNSARPSLLLWNGREHAVGEVVEYQGQHYQARAIHATILRELRLPASVGSFGSVRELHMEICKMIAQFVGLPDKFTALVSRFVLSTWLVGAMQSAPRLVIEGPDATRARQLFSLLRCICRRALPMTGVNSAGLCSLPGGMASIRGGCRDISQSRFFFVQMKVAAVTQWGPLKSKNSIWLRE